MSVALCTLRVFGKRYREVIREWEASIFSGGSNTKRSVFSCAESDCVDKISRINWAGTALNAFYAAVRKALVVVIVLRAIGVVLALGTGAWWMLWKG